ncbi:MAG: hypothetical protein LBD64_00525 [Odoribacteraceae bacterium]|jgi:hypothetical protein|nr:hypothetical protein [Odoribacteraceae bacterium]
MKTTTLFKTRHLDRGETTRYRGVGRFLASRGMMLSLALLFALAGCNKTGEPFGLTSGFRMFNLAFYSTETDSQDYRVELWGKELTLFHYASTNVQSRDMFPYAETDGAIKVYYKDETAPQLSTTYNVLERGTTIELVKTPGEPVALYDPDKHAIISLALLLNNGYSATFNDQSLISGNNYFNKNDVKGHFMYYNEAGELAGNSDEITLSPDASLVLLQTSTTEFFVLNDNGNDDGPPVEPADNHHMGLRFLWMPSADFDYHGDVRMEILVEELPLIGSHVPSVEPYTIAVDTCPYFSLTRYVELQFHYTANTAGGLLTESRYTINVYNAESDELLVSYLLRRNVVLGGLSHVDTRKFKNKMQTWIVNDIYADIISTLSVPW